MILRVFGLLLAISNCGSPDQFKRRTEFRQAVDPESADAATVEPEKEEKQNADSKVSTPKPKNKKKKKQEDTPTDDVVQFLPTFLDVAAMNPRTDAPVGTILRDVVQHLPGSFGNTYYDADQITWAHETSHGISAYLRNNAPRQPGIKVNAFYVSENKYVQIVEPNISKSKAAEFIPSSLRGSRFALYVTGAAGWEDRPLYIVDEWNSYILGGMVGVDYIKKNLWRLGQRDGVAGQMEMMVYAFGMYFAVEQYATNYDLEPLRQFIGWSTERSMAVFLEGRTFPDFQMQSQDQLYQKIKTDPSAAAWRSRVQTAFGLEWFNRVFP